MPKSLINWTAKRAGGKITITAVDKATNEPVKIIGVETIRSGVVDDGLRLPPLATRFDGAEYWLE